LELGYGGNIVLEFGEGGKRSLFHIALGLICTCWGVGGVICSLAFCMFRVCNIGNNCCMWLSLNNVFC
jgi:hypothetical protein